MLVFKQDSGLLVEGGVCDPPLTDLSEVTHTVWTQRALSCPELTSLFLMESLLSIYFAAVSEKSFQGEHI